MCIPRPWLTRPRAAQRSQGCWLLNTPRASPLRAVLAAQNTLFPRDRAVPLWGRGGVGRLRMRWWASSPPAAPRDSTCPSSQAIVPLLRARGIQGASCSGVHHTQTVSLIIHPRQLSCSHGSQNKVLTSRPCLQLSTVAPHAAHLSRTRWIPGSSQTAVVLSKVLTGKRREIMWASQKAIYM